MSVNPIVESVLLSGGLFVAMLVALELGHRVGSRSIAADPREAKTGTGAVEGSVFALLGLLVAFTFTAAAARFDRRRDLILEEANAAGTAWLRLDLLPAEDQPALRDSFRSYLDARIQAHARPADRSAVRAAEAEIERLQREVWSRAVTSAARDGRPQVWSLVLPALNELFDVGTKRASAIRTHAPPIIFGTLFGLAVLAALLAGYAMTGSGRRKWLHWVLFAAIISLTMYVIRDLEYPRLGLISVEAADRALLDAREAMKN